MYIFNVDYLQSWVDDLIIVLNEETYNLFTNIQPTAVTFSSGTWSGAITFQTSVQNLVLEANYGIQTGVSETFNVLQGKDLSLFKRLKLIFFFF